MSGCPGDPDGGTYPNWVPYPNTPLVEWQWENAVEPFWAEAGKFAADHGVKIAIELAATQVAYNTNTLRRLRQVAGPALGVNFDPSHLFYQGMDPLAVVRALGGELIFHAHAKDTRLQPHVMALNSGFDPRPMGQIAARPWAFRTVGYGHGAEWWADFISTLRMAGYDGTLSLEHEDRLIGVREGIVKGAEFLKPLLLRTEPEAGPH
jgi:sugar phosphate isomerase/epimerase